MTHPTEEQENCAPEALLTDAADVFQRFLEAVGLKPEFLHTGRESLLIVSSLDDRTLHSLVKSLAQSEQRRFATLLHLQGGAIPPVQGISIVRDRLLAAPRASRFKAVSLLGHSDAIKLRRSAEAVLGTGLDEAGNDHAAIAALKSAATTLTTTIGHQRVRLAAWTISGWLKEPWPVMAVSPPKATTRSVRAASEQELAGALDRFRESLESVVASLQEIAQRWLDGRFPRTHSNVEAELEAIRRMLEPIANVAESITSANEGTDDAADLEVARRTISDRLLREAAESLVESLTRVPIPFVSAAGAIGQALSALGIAASTDADAEQALRVVAELDDVVRNDGSDAEVDEVAERARLVLDETAHLHPDSSVGSILNAILRGRVCVRPHGEHDGAASPWTDDFPEPVGADGVHVGAAPVPNTELHGHGESGEPVGDAEQEITGDAEALAMDRDIDADDRGEDQLASAASHFASIPVHIDSALIDVDEFILPLSLEGPADGATISREQAPCGPAADLIESGALCPAGANLAEPSVEETISHQPRGSHRAEVVELQATEARRHALAAHAARKAGAEGRARAHAAIALVAAVRSGTGELAAASARIFTENRGDLPDDRSAQLLTLAAALRLSVFAPGPEVIEALTTIRPTLSNAEELRSLIDLMLQVCRAGVNISAESSALRASADIQLAIDEAKRAASDELRTGANRTNKFTAATKVWSSWMRRDGLLGNLLVAAERDDRRSLAGVRSELERLRDRSEVVKEIHDADPRARQRNEITAGARDRLIDWSQRTLNVLAAWIEAVDASLAGKQQASAVGGLVDRLKNLVQSQREVMVRELASNDGSPILRVSALAASLSLEETLELMRSGTSVSGPEPSADTVLNRPMLLAPGPRALADGSLDGEPSIDDLEAALDSDEEDPTSWADAYHRRANVGDHEATRMILGVLEHLAPDLEVVLSAKRAQDVELAQAERVRTCRRVGDDLASARSHGQLNDAAWSGLAGDLEAVSTGSREDFGFIDQSLDAIRAGLNASREVARRNLFERLQELKDLKRITPAALGRVEDVAGRGDFATADEYIALLRDELPLPDSPAPRLDLAGWWPDAVQLLASTNVDSRFVNIVRKGECCAGLSFEGLDQLARDEAAHGLEAWIAFSDEQRGGRSIGGVGPLLRLLGIEASDFQRLSGQKKTPERAWYQLVGFRPTGRALIPDFGSLSSGSSVGRNALVMLVWGKPRAATVASWVAGESSSRPVHIWYFGPLDVTERVQLADHLRESRHRRPVAIIDDTLVAYLAATASRDYESTMRLALPFAASNPYLAVGGLTPPEMFYGRDTERQALSDMMGSALVYGGRQLGKSSLLRATQRDFDDGGSRRAMYLDLRAEQIGGVKPPAEIWRLLWRSLEAIGVIKGSLPSIQPRERLETSTIRWLDDIPGRALLILLDECDNFLSADAASGFDTVDALDGFMVKAGRRIKFVFAGLHRVQRFASVENQPLAHLGIPIAVGPLRSSDAMRLVVRPTEALGYQFEHDELPARILAFCNNNPSLLVLFMQALIARMLDTRLQRPGVSRPPVVITDADVEATYSKESLAEQIKERFDLTLDLDPAYKVIAYTVAHDALEHRPGDELSTRKLRETAIAWWPRGFAGITHDGFRSLCDELVDLGVFARRGGNYGLRSPNILRFLGSSDQIIEVLIEAEHREPVGTFDAASARPRLAGDPGRRSPLSAAQLLDLVAPRDQVRLVLGTIASGLDDVVDAARQAADETATVEQPNARTTKLSSFKNTTGRHRVLVLDLRTLEIARARNLLHEALHQRADLGTVGIVFLADVRLRELLHEILVDRRWERINLVEIGRVDRAAWTHWVDDAEIVPDSDELLQYSGGWLSLLEPAAAACARTASAAARRTAVSELKLVCSDHERATAFLAQVGLGTGPLAAGFSAICDEFPDGAESELLQLAIPSEDENSTAAAADVELLTMIGALAREGELLVPEPVLSAALRLAR